MTSSSIKPEHPLALCVTHIAPALTSDCVVLPSTGCTPNTKMCENVRGRVVGNPLLSFVKLDADGLYLLSAGSKLPFTVDEPAACSHRFLLKKQNDKKKNGNLSEALLPAGHPSTRLAIHTRRPQKKDEGDVPDAVKVLESTICVYFSWPCFTLINAGQERACFFYCFYHHFYF